MTIEEIISFCKTHKKEIQKIVEIEFYKKIAKDFITKYDTNLVTPEKDLNLNLKKIINVIEEDIKNNIKISKVCNNRIDYDFETILYIHHNETNTLVNFFTENEAIIKYWQSINIVKEYYYQDSTDKPTKISKKNWEKRYNDWKNCLDNFCSISDNGLKYTLSDIDIDFRFFYNYANMLKYIPTYDNRCKKIAQNIFINEYYNKNKNPNINDIQSGLFFEAREELEKNPTNTEYINILNNVKNKIPAEITIDIIKNAKYIINELT
jgi:hypothetical protein